MKLEAGCSDRSQLSTHERPLLRARSLRKQGSPGSIPLWEGPSLHDWDKGPAGPRYLR